MGALVVIAERIPRRVKGMLLGLVAAASFTLLHTTVRYASRELHVFEITFFRYFIALVFMLPGLVTSRFEVLRTRRLHLHLIRCVMLMISMLGLFSALTMSPIAIGHGAELRLAGLRIGGRHPVPARALHGQPGVVVLFVQIGALRSENLLHYKHLGYRLFRALRIFRADWCASAGVAR
jgi:hypothetical protein